MIIKSTIMRPDDAWRRGTECLRLVSLGPIWCLESYLMAFLDKEITIPALALSLLSAARMPSVLL